MTAASTSAVHTFRPQLLDRRARLQAAGTSISAAYLNDLIEEVDSALRRIDAGSYGLCETCHDPIETHRLESDPLVRFCLDHLSQAEMLAHQQDLDLATQIQSRLLPPRDIALESWDTQYRYEPVGAVGGDYCDLKSLFFAVGDVAGKGVAASLLMTHLSAIFRSLLSLDLSLADVVSRANRLFCESTAPAQTGLPLGLFRSGQYTVQHISLGAGESLALYSDGITEAQNPAGDEYQEDRLIDSLRNHFEHGAGVMADSVLQDVARFRQARPPVDDMTLLIVRRRG